MRVAYRQSVARGTLAFGEYGLKQGSRMDYRPADRSFACGDHSLHQAAAANCGSAFSGQAVHQEACRNRMGKGKGAPEKWVSVVKPGRIMFEMAGVDEATARKLGAGIGQTAIPHEIRHPLRRILIMPRRIEKIREAGVNELTRSKKS